MQRPMAHVKTMEAANIIKDVDSTATNPFTVVKESMVQKTILIGAEAVAVKPTLTLHITVGHTKCVPIQVNTAGPQ